MTNFSRRLAALLIGLFLTVAPAGAQSISATGTIDANGQSVTLITGGIGLPAGGWATVAIQITGTWTGTVQFEGSVDAATYAALKCTPIDGSAGVTSATDDGVWTCPSAGLQVVRVRASAAVTGTATVYIRGNPSGGAGSGGSISGGVTVGDVGVTSLTLGGTAVSAVPLTNLNGLGVAILDANGDQITSFGGGTQYTEDAAAASNPTGNALIGVRQDTLSAATVSADGDNIALRSTSKGELYVKQTDTVPVTGTFWQATQPVSLASVPSHAVTNAGTFAVQAAQSGTWNVTNVSGTVSLPTGAATAANQTTGNSSLSSIDGKFPTAAAIANGFSNPTASKIMAMNSIWDTGTSQWVYAQTLVADCSDPSQTTSVAISTSSSGYTQLVAIDGTKVIYVCGYNFVLAGAGSANLVEGTGTACGTGTTAKSGPQAYAANAGISVPNGGAVQFKTGAGAALCLNLSAAVQTGGLVTYIQK